MFPIEAYGSTKAGRWAGLVGGVFITLGSHGVDQLMVQRYLSARGLKDARRALWVSGIVVAAQFAFFLLIGVGLWSFYQLHPPAVPFDRPDRVFARFILGELPVGLVGLLLGAIFAAAMTSSLNSCATVAVNDLYLPRRAGRSPRTASSASPASSPRPSERCRSRWGSPASG
jgi:Na+/proline symporter